MWIDHSLWLWYSYFFLLWLLTFPNNYQRVAGGFYFLLLLSRFLGTISSIGLFAVGRTSMVLTLVILKHCLGSWFIPIHQRTSYHSLVPIPTVNMTNV